MSRTTDGTIMLPLLATAIVCGVLGISAGILWPRLHEAWNGGSKCRRR